jgi:hypothetical protein
VHFLYFSLYFSFFIYFVVLACWVEDVNNFMAWELRMMSFGRRMLLSMYRIELSRTNMLLQLKINYGLVDFDVIDRS